MSTINDNAIPTWGEILGLFDSTFHTRDLVKCDEHIEHFNVNIKRIFSNPDHSVLFEHQTKILFIEFVIWWDFNNDMILYPYSNVHVMFDHSYGTGYDMTIGCSYNNSDLEIVYPDTADRSNNMLIFYRNPGLSLDSAILTNYEMRLLYDAESSDIDFLFRGNIYNNFNGVKECRINLRTITYPNIELNLL